MCVCVCVCVCVYVCVCVELFKGVFFCIQTGAPHR